MQRRRPAKEGVNQKEQFLHTKKSVLFLVALMFALLLAALMFAMSTRSPVQNSTSADTANEPRVCTSFQHKDAWSVSRPCGQAYMRYWGVAYNRQCRLGADTKTSLNLGEIAATNFLAACGCSKPCK